MDATEQRERLRGLPFPDLPPACYKLLDFLERTLAKEGEFTRPFGHAGMLLQDVPRRLADPKVLRLCIYHGLVFKTEGPEWPIILSDCGAACVADWRLRQSDQEKKPPVSPPTFNLTTGMLKIDGTGYSLDASESLLLEKIIKKGGAAQTCDLKEIDKPAKVIKRLLEKYPKLKGHLSSPATRGNAARGQGGYQTDIQAVPESGTI
jgi:hypothetical protein